MTETRVEAAARAMAAMGDADNGEHGWQDFAEAALAAADAVSDKTEWAIFRKTDPLMGASPMEAGTFGNQAKAERIIALYYVDGPDWLEARSREVTEWKKPGGAA